jgi:two-component system, sensor histidine kinase YesM
MGILKINNHKGSVHNKVIPYKFFKGFFTIKRKTFNYASKTRRILKNAKMQNKLILSFLALSLIPLIISGVFSVNSSSKTIKGKISTYSLQLVNQVNQNINTSLLKIKNYSDDIIISPDVNNRLTGYKNMGETDKATIRFIFSRALQLKFLNTSNVDDVLMIFINNENQTDYDTTHVGNQFRWKKEELDRIIRLNNQKENTKNFTLSLANIEGTDGTDIVIGRKSGNGMTSDVMGHLFIAVNQDYLRDIYKDIDIGKGADIFIFDSDGILISGKNPGMNIGKLFPEKKLIEQIKKDDKPNGSTFSIKIGKENQLVAYSKIENTNLYIVSTIPYSYLNSETSNFNFRIAFLTFAILILAIIVSFIISQGISAPLKKLEKSMVEFGEGKINNRVEVDREDEIGHLQKSFNSMAIDIKELLVKIEKENKLRRMTELKVLEYQINPHFLYNTLDTINWMAQKAGQPDIGSMVTALARFFRLGLSKGKEIYTIKDEIEHVHNYLIISKIRYKECFKFNIEVDTEIMEYKTLKIILQPLVENAIKYGISKNNNQGCIHITGRNEGNSIILQVADNGRGIEKEKLNYLNKALTEMQDISSNESGFGLLNVHQRIKLNYGENYGVFLESQTGEGTTVKITLPIVT